MRFEFPSKPLVDRGKSMVYSYDGSEKIDAKNMVYLLWFVPEGDDGEDEALFIGVYAEKDGAEAAIRRLQNKPGFTDFTEGFQVHRYEVGRDSWTEGFVRD